MTRSVFGLARAAVVVFALLIALGCATQGNVTKPETAEAGDAGEKPESRFIGGAEEEAVRPKAVEVEAVRVSYARGGANYVIAGEATATGPRPELTPAEIPGPAGPTKPGRRGVGFPLQAPGPPDSIAPPSQGAVSAPAPTPQGAVPLTSFFDTIDFDTNLTNTGGFVFIPPDSHAAVGPNHVVVVTNVSIRIHEKDGTLLHDESLQDFFSVLSPPTFTFDPKVLFDDVSQRFVVVTLELKGFGTAPTNDDESKAYLAVSDDADPTGTWFAFAIDSKLNISGNHWLDFPGFAVDEEAVYLNGNMFSFMTGNFGGVRLWTIEKGESGGWYDGMNAVVHGEFDPYTAMGAIATTTQPAMIRSDPSATYGAPGDDVGTFLVSYSGINNGTDEFVQIVRMDDPIGTPTFVHEFVNIGNIEALAAALPNAPQMGSGTAIETNDRRALDAVWRDGQLYMTATIDPISGGDAGEATAHWWHLDTSTLSDEFDDNTTLAEQGDLGGEDIASNAHTYYPSIDVNAAGDLAIGYSASAPSIFAGSFYSIRESGNASFGAADTLRAGEDWYVRTFGGGRNRWGDYSGMVVEESTGCFWVYNQHAMTRGTETCRIDPGEDPCPAEDIEDGRWRTAVGEICIAECLVAATVTTSITGSETFRATTITVAGTAEVTATGILRLEGHEVGFENGFSVASGGEMSVAHACVP